MNKKLLKALKWIVDILKKHSIQYQISGGFAAHLYSAQRPVNDIDIDFPEDKFDNIYDEIKEFITFGPAHYKDERWDLKLVTLNFHGQEIDIGGAYTTKIYDDTLNTWVSVPVDFSKAQTLNIQGMKVSVIDLHDLIEYKKLLSGTHQMNDIEAVQKYIKKK